MNRASSHSLLDLPARIAIAGDWHADSDYGVATVGNPIDNNMVVVNLPQLGFHRLINEEPAHPPCSA